MLTLVVLDVIHQHSVVQRIAIRTKVRYVKLLGIANARVEVVEVRFSMTFQLLLHLVDKLFQPMRTFKQTVVFRLGLRGLASIAEPRMPSHGIAEPRIAEPRIAEPRIAEPRMQCASYLGFAASYFGFAAYSLYTRNNKLGFNGAPHT